MPLTLRLPDELHASVIAGADEMGISANAFIILALDNYLRWRKKAAARGFHQVVIPPGASMPTSRRLPDLDPLLEVDDELEKAMRSIEAGHSPKVNSKPKG